jgi:phosphatidylinositol alpha 1,6-mannosyltransferase
VDLVIWSWLRRVHRHVARTLVPSSATTRELAARGIPRLALWRRGVDLTHFHPRHRSAALRGQLAPGGEVIVGYIGRLATEKRLHLLTHLSDLPNARLVVVGDGPAAPRLRRQLPDARFLGLKTGGELWQAFASLDVFVHAGSNETFCQAIQEALAAGVPVVAPAAGGPLDLVRPGVNGLLYPPDDLAGLRSAVQTLVSHPRIRQSMAGHARASVSANTWPAVCAELLDHYASVTSPEKRTSEQRSSGQRAGRLSGADQPAHQAAE